MSDIQHVVSVLEAHGPGMAGAVAGAYALKKVFGPSLDSVGARLKEISDQRLANFGRITARAESLRPDADIYPHVRVTQRVLNDATLYDDDVQQTYVAGMLAGSRNADGSDDRPVFFLSVIDGLTAAQLRLFHVFYAAAAQSLRGETFDIGGPIKTIEVRVDDVNANILLMDPDDTEEDGMSDLFALEHVGLIVNLGADQGPDGRGRVQFMTTRIGALLYDWAHGISDGDLSQFGTRERPDIQLPAMAFSNL